MLEIGQYLNQYKMLAFRYQYIYRYDIDHLDEYYYLLTQKKCLYGYKELQSCKGC